VNDTRLPRCLARAAVVAALGGVPLLAAAPTASAHPFGPPQTVEISRTGDDAVSVLWRFGATDDISYLGAGLGVLPEERMTLDGAVFYEDGDDDLLAEADAFHDYLLERLVVTTGGEACEGEVQPAGSLASDGIEVAYACPTAADRVDLTVEMLLDQHPAYRTLASGPAGARQVYDAQHPTHTWQLGPAPSGSDDGASDAGSRAGEQATSTGRSAALQLSAVGGGAAVLAAAGWLWLRRRRA